MIHTRRKSGVALCSKEEAKKKQRQVDNLKRDTTIAMTVLILLLIGMVAILVMILTGVIVVE